jgi:hypothetical protein
MLIVRCNSEFESKNRDSFSSNQARLVDHVGRYPDRSAGDAGQIEFRLIQ